MARKKLEPIVTHVEILSRAIKSYDDEIEKWETAMDGKQEMLEMATGPLKRKRQAVAEIYKIETGSEY